MLRTFIWFLYFWLYLILLLPVLFYYWRLDLRHDPRLDDKVNRKVQNWARRLMRVAGMRVTVNGRENLPDHAAVYIANHQGNFDIPLILSSLNRAHGLLAKQELARIPILRLWMRLLHCLFVDRSSPRAGVESIAEGVKLLQSGHSLVIFPEGTRSKDGEIHRFKAGAFALAKEAGVAVLPVVLDGTPTLIRRNGLFNWGNRMTVRVLPPVPAGRVAQLDTHELMDEVRGAMCAALEEIRKDKR